FLPAIGPVEGDPIAINNISWAVMPSPVPLSELNAQNKALSFQPLPGNPVVNLDPGVKSPPFSIPQAVSVGQAVILRYVVTGPGSAAQATDFVQFRAGDGACCLPGAPSECLNSVLPAACASQGGIHHPNEDCSSVKCPTLSTVGMVAMGGLVLTATWIVMRRRAARNVSC
ncbi:MAG: hypothetical protein AABZ47_12395, partial [Planctomycetota bacterium]